MEVESIETELPENIPPPPRAAAKARQTDVSRSPVARAMENEDDLSVRDWLDSLAGDSEIKVNITRKKPLLGPHGEVISGSLETVDGRVDEDYIRETWGGGEFLLKVYVPKGPNGAVKYFRGRTIKIAGPVKMHGAAVNGSGAAPAVIHEEDTLAGRAFETMERNAERAQLRADRIEQAATNRPQGFDVGAMQTLNQPLFEQLRAQQDTIAQLQTQVIAMSGKAPPRDEFRDKLMERMLDGESARIEALRAQYENRIDKLKDSHEDQIKRLEDRHLDEIKRLESRHERELRISEKTIDGQIKNQDVAFGARLEARQSENARLERDLIAASAKIAALEARKDQTIGEKADELIKVKEALDGIGGGSDDKDEAWYEKIIGAVGNSEVAVNFINKISGGGAAGAAPMPPPQQLPPPGIPFSNGDGNVYVRDHAGNVTIVDQGAMRQQRQLAAVRKKKKATVAAAAAGELDADTEEAPADDGAPVGRAPDAAEMKIAVTFMENAIRGGATPEQFGRTAAALIPTDILTYMHHVGIEKFLTLARIEQGSPLTTIRGRQFARQVAKFLSEGSIGEPGPTPAE